MFYVADIFMFDNVVPCPMFSWRVCWWCRCETQWMNNLVSINDHHVTCCPDPTHSIYISEPKICNDKMCAELSVQIFHELLSALKNYSSGHIVN